MFFEFGINMKKLVFLVVLFLSTSVIADISQLKLELLLAKRGDISAQFRIATAYEYGTDIKKDFKEALKWYMKAADQSHAQSQYKIGYFYEHALGVTKDMGLAMLWYNKAKDNGNDEAIHRLHKKSPKKIKAAKTQKSVVKKKIEKKVKLVSKKPSQQKKSTKTKPVEIKNKTIVKRSPVKKKRIIFKVSELMNMLLNNKWRNKHGAADFLPSLTTTCLASGSSELTCFSSEKTRKIKRTKVTFTTKATLFAFKSNGTFKITYNYNGLNIAGAKSKASDIYGLKMKQGWQEPAIAIKCRAFDRKNLTCYRGNKKISFRL